MDASRVLFLTFASEIAPTALMASKAFVSSVEATTARVQTVFPRPISSAKMPPPAEFQEEGKIVEEEHFPVDTEEDADEGEGEKVDEIEVLSVPLLVPKFTIGGDRSKTPATGDA